MLLPLLHQQLCCVTRLTHSQSLCLITFHSPWSNNFTFPLRTLAKLCPLFPFPHISPGKGVLLPRRPLGSLLAALMQHLCLHCIMCKEGSGGHGLYNLPLYPPTVLCAQCSFKTFAKKNLYIYFWANICTGC